MEDQHDEIEYSVTSTILLSAFDNPSAGIEDILLLLPVELEGVVKGQRIISFWYVYYIFFSVHFHIFVALLAVSQST